MQYRCEATSLTGFIQQLACAYLRHGYVYFVEGEVPAGKDPRAVDTKLLGLYGIAASKWQRARRKRVGIANLQYLRFGRRFVLLATEGRHAFFVRERMRLRDARESPIRFGGYAISVRAGHVHVRIDLNTYRDIRAHLFSVAVHRQASALAAEFYTLPFEPYAPIRRQLLNLLRLVNKSRKAAGYQLLPYTVLHLRRRIVRPFDVAFDRRAA